MSMTQMGQPAAAALPCGVLWFLHIPKTGGTSVKEFLRSVAARTQWTFVELQEHGPLSAETWIRTTIHAARTRDANATTPRFLVHQHGESPGLGSALLPDLLRRLNNTLRLEDLAAQGCRLALTAVLREPIARTTSSLYFNGVGRHEVRAFVADQSDRQAKFIMNGVQHPSACTWVHNNTKRPCTSTNHTLLASPELVHQAYATLASFDLVGRFERFDAFIAELARMLRYSWESAVPHMLKHHKRPFNLSRDDQFWIAQHNVGDAWLYDSLAENRWKSPRYLDL